METLVSDYERAAVGFLDRLVSPNIGAHELAFEFHKQISTIAGRGEPVPDQLILGALAANRRWLGTDRSYGPKHQWRLVDQLVKAGAQQGISQQELANARGISAAAISKGLNKAVGDDVPSRRWKTILEAEITLFSVGHMSGEVFRAINDKGEGRRVTEQELEAFGEAMHIIQQRTDLWGLSAHAPEFSALREARAVGISARSSWVLICNELLTALFLATNPAVGGTVTPTGLRLMLAGLHEVQRIAGDEFAVALEARIGAVNELVSGYLFHVGEDDGSLVGRADIPDELRHALTLLEMSNLEAALDHYNAGRAIVIGDSAFYRLADGHVREVNDFESLVAKIGFAKIGIGIRHWPQHENALSVHPAAAGLRVSRPVDDGQQQQLTSFFSEHVSSELTRNAIVFAVDEGYLLGFAGSAEMFRDHYGLVEVLDQSGKVLGEICIPTEDAFDWWIQRMPASTTETD